MLTYETAGNLARITIDRPAKLNALTYGMWTSLPDLVARAEAETGVRLIVLTGRGDRSFSAGADISEFADKRNAPAQVADYERCVARALDRITHASKPVLAIVRGLCFGGGLALALACDLRFASTDARFRIPAARLGLGYATAGIRTMVGRLGIGPSADLLLSARTIEAAEALRLGIVNRLFDSASFEPLAEAALTEIAGNAPLTLQAVKRALSELARPEAERDFAAADRLVETCFESEDYREGQKAFRERRDPVFLGR